jgi:hypothetical protein
MTKVEKFNELFQVPPAMRRYIELVVEPGEIDLVLAMNGETLDASGVGDRLGLASQAAEELLLRAYRRHVVSKVVDGKTVNYVFDYVEEKERQVRFAPARFYDRLDPVTTQENWGDIPEEVRKEISQWWLDGYIEKVGPVIEQSEPATICAKRASGSMTVRGTPSNVVWAVLSVKRSAKRS